ncbi:MAG: BNR repeat-containing protein, partial [Rectinema sp.]|nr:BNR repeat-containing protein [Rectinema sp.]
YCMFLDEPRGQLYFWAHNGVFAVLGLDGTVRSSANLFTRGQAAYLQYPHLFLDTEGVLHAAWTTSKDGVYLYWDIHYMRSRDGGQTWESMDGIPLTLPIVADHAGPSDRISLDDEFEVHTWLSGMYVRGEKLFFAYLAQFQDRPRQHLMRYGAQSSRREIDISPMFRGESIEIRGLDGFFCASRDLKDRSLYFVGHAFGGGIGILRSEDQGATWHDHALSEQRFPPYALGGSRWLSEDGFLLGSLTHQDAEGGNAVYFFRVPGSGAVHRDEESGKGVKSL